MNGWAWIIAVIIGMRVVFVPFMVGRPRERLTPGAGVILILIYLAELYVFLRAVEVIR